MTDHTKDEAFEAMPIGNITFGPVTAEHLLSSGKVQQQVMLVKELRESADTTESFEAMALWEVAYDAWQETMGKTESVKVKDAWQRVADRLREAIEAPLLAEIETQNKALKFYAIKLCELPTIKSQVISDEWFARVACLAGVWPMHDKDNVPNGIKGAVRAYHRAMLMSMEEGGKL